MTMDEYIKKEDVLKEIESTAMWSRPYCDLYEAVQDIQAADVAPVRRGRWEFPIFSDTVDYELDPRCKCSECGSVEMPLARHKFCPNCGARMDGDEKC